MTRSSPDAAPRADLAAPLTLRQSVLQGLPYLLVVLLLHGLALVLWVPAALHAPLLWGVGFTAYLFGLRHAWDADHIAVIDNTVRKLLTLGRPAYGVGLSFSLGHSAVVFLMAVAAAIVGKALLGAQEGIGAFGGWVGPFVAGAYLVTVAAVNLSSALQILRAGDEPGHQHSGLLARLIAPLTRLVSWQWQVLPLGFLMGLGFDTASEVALLALSGTAAQQGLSWAAILSLPLLFAAGMTLLDTLDGVAMAHAYGWALHNPRSKRTYNLLVTGLSGVIALVIGVVTLAQWAGEHFPAAEASLAALQDVDVSPLGFWLAGLTLLLFVAAQLWTRARRV
ncbi:high-affinity nickel-transporter (plasmid) [Deinococcus geothermalis DSM 11300]|uniref:Nickel/cobalt efflux system n=1 Tax=Deinococcus geothermalis (strain DSM 11300 / CIP 105573 / AG-3a) TaxID=319795 RepID=Q1J3Z0_DEIGD|nr:high frequency lysogenization protein HflD [Deinococcus geothermalis]ABF43788.1 high-affinity nickel-transporter [Deinococcus geothermalis DSM 11300]